MNSRRHCKSGRVRRAVCKGVCPFLVLSISFPQHRFAAHFSLSSGSWALAELNQVVWWYQRSCQGMTLTHCLLHSPTCCSFQVWMTQPLQQWRTRQTTTSGACLRYKGGSQGKGREGPSLWEVLGQALSPWKRCDHVFRQRGCCSWGGIRFKIWDSCVWTEETALNLAVSVSRLPPVMLALPLLKLQIRCSPDIGHRLCCLPPSTCFCGKSLSLCNSATSATGVAVSNSISLSSLSERSVGPGFL